MFDRGGDEIDQRVEIGLSAAALISIVSRTRSAALQTARRQYVSTWKQRGVHARFTFNLSRRLTSVLSGRLPPRGEDRRQNGERTQKRLYSINSSHKCLARKEC